MLTLRITDSQGYLIAYIRGPISDVLDMAYCVYGNYFVWKIR